jgi:TRAP-type C4-dicarboxylate transport system, small permease component
MIVVSLDVLSRFFLNSPILGAMEFSLLLMISIVYFGLGYTEYTNRHISINIIYNKLHTNQQFFIRNLNYIILIIISSILFWHSFLDFLKSYEMNEILPGMAGFPK